MNTITPIPGQHYRTRDGSRYRCYAVDAGGQYPVHGAFYSALCEKWDNCEHALDGGFYKDHTNGFDIVAEWSEPMVPWSECPSWVQWQAMDPDGEVVGFRSPPEFRTDCWLSACAQPPNTHFPNEVVTHRPSDWRKSLVQRPA